MKTLKERIEIETAGLNGEVIERRFLQGINSDYEIKPDADHDDAVYCWPDFDYRIKPEPRVIYVATFRDGTPTDSGGIFFIPDYLVQNRIEHKRFVEDLDYKGNEP